MPLMDDDRPNPPDPWADDWASAQAKRALLLALGEDNEKPSQPLPVVLYD